MVSEFQRWLAPAALVAGLVLCLLAIAQAPDVDERTEWTRLIICLLGGFVVMGIAVARRINSGTGAAQAALVGFDADERQQIKERRHSDAVERRLRGARQRYASAREEIDNRSGLVVAGLALLNGGTTVATTTGVVFRLSFFVFLLVAGVWSVVSAERWRAVTQEISAHDCP